MKRVLIAAVAGATVAALSVPASAQYRNWQTIAYKTVNRGTDVDRINVRGSTRYREVRLCAYNAPINMRDFDIRFENNQRQDVRVRERIRAGTCTRNIDLLGSRRDIEWIRLKYSPIARNYARPLVRVQVRG